MLISANEGDNPQMFLQQARDLLKQYNSAVNKKKPAIGLLAFANNIDAALNTKCTVKTVNDWFLPEHHIAAFTHRSARLLYDTAQRINNEIKSGSDNELAIENAKVDLIRVAKSHCHLVIYNNFLQSIKELKTDEAIKNTLTLLCNLYAVYTIENELGEFNLDNYITHKQIQLLNESVRILLNKLRPSVVGLVDSFDFSDHYLNSALGRYDGNVYESLYNWANMGNPMNKSQLAPGVERILLPMLKNNREKLALKSKL